MTKKNILERIISNAAVRVGTNMLARAMTPSKPVAVAVTAMPRVAILPSAESNPQRTYYVNTAKGFIIKNKGVDGCTYTPNIRAATSFPSFQRADEIAKFAVKKLPPGIRYFAIVQPAIGK